MKILLTTTSFQDTPGEHHDLLKKTGWKIITARGPLNEADTLALVGEVDGYICGDDAITRKVLEKARPKLKVLSKYGIGVDKIDVKSCTEFGIPLLFTPGVNHTTVAEHMPASHRAHREWTPQRLIAWGVSIGARCGQLVRWQMEHRPHPEQGYRACLGLQRLARQFGPQRLEAACARALAIGSPTYRSVASILASGVDRQLVAAPAEVALPLHENVRGADYYH